MKKEYQSVRVFQNPYLERLTHVHPAVPLLLWGPVISWLLWRSLAVEELSLAAVVSLGMAGLLVWTLVEYLVHRFLFHFDARTKLQKRLIFLMHGLHHEDPVDPTRLVMPPAASLILASAFYGLFWLLWGGRLVQPFFATFLVGYLCYDYIHYSIHHFPARGKIGKFLKKSHMLHHYGDPNSRWGVSSPLWDYVFGTMSERRAESQRLAWSVPRKRSTP